MITIFFTNKEHPWSRGKRWVSLYVPDLFDESQKPDSVRQISQKRGGKITVVARAKITER